MNASPKPGIVGPPRLLSSFIEGFNIVASNVWLILPPFLLDLFLWLGPRLSLKNILMPLIERISSELYLSTAPTEDVVAAVKATREIWEQVAAKSNLLGVLRSFPVGIPSLISSMGDVANPIITPFVQNLDDSALAIGLAILLTIIGICLGSFYFEMITGVVVAGDKRFELKNVFKTTLRVLSLCLMFYAIILGAGIPAMIVIGLISLVNVSFGQIVMLVVGLLVLWLVMPMVFSVHGLFVLREKVLASVMTSIRLVRFFLPTTGLFILTALLVDKGLNLLWSSAPEGSWLILVSVFGHAFISTALFCSSFVYYQGGLRWMKSRQESNQPVPTGVI